MARGSATARATAMMVVVLAGHAAAVAVDAVATSWSGLDRTVEMVQDTHVVMVMVGVGMGMCVGVLLGVVLSIV